MDARIRRAAMTWAQRLKQVFGIDIETCPACGGTVRIIACFEDPDVIETILAHLDAKAAEPEATRRPSAGRHPSRDCSTRPGNPAMTSFGLCRQRRGKGVARRGNRQEGVEVRWRGRRRDGFEGAMPICTLMGESARPVDRRCRRRSGKTTRCEPPKRRFILYGTPTTTDRKQRPQISDTNSGIPLLRR